MTPKAKLQCFKQRHSTHAAAKRHADSLRWSKRGLVECYVCLRCGFWHVGHKFFARK